MICTDGFRPERAMVYAVLVPHVWATGRRPPGSNQGAQHGHSITAPGVGAVWQRGECLVHGTRHRVFDPRLPGKTLTVLGLTEDLPSASSVTVGPVYGVQRLM